MNLKELEYIIKIGECGNLASAAQALYITPSALSQHLGKVEEELGTPLFYRARGNWQPTPAGMEYISTCRKILELKADSYRKIRDISNIRKGTLRIGMPPERAKYVIRDVYPKFHQEYDKIALNFHETYVRTQQKLIESGELDLGLVTISDKDTDDNSYILLSNEEVFLAVPSDDPRCDLARPEAGSRFPVMDLKPFDGTPFALMSRSSTLRPVQNDIFSRHNITPQILFETSRVETALDMVSEGICSSLVSGTYIKCENSSFRYFCLKDHPMWHVSIVYKKGRYLSEPEQRFITLTREFWQQVLEG